MEGYSAGRVQGPLAPYAAGFVVELVGRGYRPCSVRGQLELMAHLSRWLADQGLEPGELTPKTVERFLAVRREREVSLRSWRALGPLVGYLRGLGAVPELVASADTPAERLLSDYREYLLRERGLTAGSVAHWERVARLFLAERSEPLEDALRRLTTGEVTGFVVARCAPGRCSGSTAKILTGGLRSLLRYLHVAGFTAIPLAQAVPRAAGWRLSSLPRALEGEQVARLLESCDRATVSGRRDLAILFLLARLGLRCCEVAGLCLDDIDWRTGEVTIRGKGSATERLPLPHDVGEAMADYLRDGRPAVGFREVFVTAQAPRRPLSPTGVTHVVGCACKRVGMEPVGAHRLRHTLASDLLRAGTPLAQIAPILRHATVATTAIYAKVDRDALRTLARPWPLAGGAA
ncbi:MAG: site-specific integrase [Actinobacteria bacterium]|nr:site-specific integrase [Actinomycetota bacterium]